MLARRLISGIVALSFLGTVATGAVYAAPAHATMEKVTVKITTTGSTVWGKVKATYDVGKAMKSKTCSKSSCKWSLAEGTKLTFSQTPTNSTTWPFHAWKVKNSGKTKTVMGKKTSFKIGMGAVTVTAIYVVK